MNQIATGEKIEQLEQRHLHLLDELDTLNSHLEHVLRSFGKQGENDEIPSGE